jgi:hypothetical protein
MEMLMVVGLYEGLNVGVLAVVVIGMGVMLWTRKV